MREVVPADPVKLAQATYVELLRLRRLSQPPNTWRRARFTSLSTQGGSGATLTSQQGIGKPVEVPLPGDRPKGPGAKVSTVIDNLSSNNPLSIWTGGKGSKEPAKASDRPNDYTKILAATSASVAGEMDHLYAMYDANTGSDDEFDVQWAWYDPVAGGE